VDISGGDGRVVAMTRKVAIPVFGSRVSSRLDCSESVLLLIIDDGTVLRRQETRWSHVNALEKIRLLVHEGVEVLICGGLTETCANMLHDTGIEVIPWVRGESEEVLTRYMHGALQTASLQQEKRR
jgi:predicted Fe-Mo cluster-binding NifX family protein